MTRRGEPFSNQGTDMDEKMDALEQKISELEDRVEMNEDLIQMCAARLNEQRDGTNADVERGP